MYGCHLTLLFMLLALEVNATNQQIYVQKHNALRTTVQPQAANMKKIMFSRELELIAQNHASGCSFNHNANRSGQSSTFITVGENIYYGRRGDNITDAIEYWGQQGDYYNIQNNDCQLFKFCEYYTQVTWAKSEYVGCGSSECGTNSFIVCNYGPSGDLNQRPYIQGRSCSACPRGYYCEINLCTKSQ